MRSEGARVEGTESPVLLFPCDGLYRQVPPLEH